MSSFDMSEFDPLNMGAAYTYVQSVMVPHKVNEIVTKADVHTEGIVSNLNYSNGRAKRRLESDSPLNSVKKLKPTTVDNANDIIRLMDSPQCSKNFVSSEHSSDSNKSDISELKGLVVGLTGSLNNFVDIITKRMDSIETSIPIQIANLIDIKVSEELKKVTHKFQEDIKVVSDKVTSLEKSYADLLKQKSVVNDEKLLVVVRNLPQTETENVLKNATALIKDGL
ncbi:unnamed protein product [Mytilus coruscus]|uniref:Uncharacterized protein n=1 Tax=Mytilus coruscus TaxID=42192 RepID=A0A6J8DMT6_MYTCO|nr:unnamed protein product [Mytilus coruscus]